MFKTRHKLSKDIFFVMKRMRSCEALYVIRCVESKTGFSHRKGRSREDEFFLRFGSMLSLKIKKVFVG